jgi:hypothetical protein
MATGRCAGCGKSGPPKKVQAHIMTCPDYAELYRADPARALPPEAEHARWAAQDKEADKAARRAALAEAGAARRADQVGRFARLPDILDDPEEGTAADGTAG